MSSARLTSGDIPAGRSNARPEPSELSPYAVGIIHHRTYSDLEACLASVKGQTAPPVLIVVIDTDPDPGLHRDAAARHPEVQWVAAPNRGFGAGANAALRLSDSPELGAEYTLVLNPDIQLEPSFAEQLLLEMRRHPQAALASGKLLRADGRTLDSTGILLPRHRRPRDRASEEPDRGQYDRTELLFGVSGAAMLIRHAALPDLEVDGELFDEDFFLYHEDTDLAWRANRLGWRCLYVPQARALHGRRWQRQKRFAIPPSVRRHSFKNHYLSMLKNERGRDFVVNLPVLLVWELARFGYALAFDREILGGYRMAWRLQGRMWEKRRGIGEKARSPCQGHLIEGCTHGVADARTNSVDTRR